MARMQPSRKRGRPADWPEAVVREWAREVVDEGSTRGEFVKHHGEEGRKPVYNYIRRAATQYLFGDRNPATVLSPPDSQGRAKILWWYLDAAKYIPRWIAHLDAIGGLNDTDGVVTVIVVMDACQILKGGSHHFTTVRFHIAEVDSPQTKDHQRLLAAGLCLDKLDHLQLYLEASRLPHHLRDLNGRLVAGRRLRFALGGDLPALCALLGHPHSTRAPACCPYCPYVRDQWKWNPEFRGPLRRTIEDFPRVVAPLTSLSLAVYDPVHTLGNVMNAFLSCMWFYMLDDSPEHTVIGRAYLFTQHMYHFDLRWRPPAKLKPDNDGGYKMSGFIAKRFLWAKDWWWDDLVRIVPLSYTADGVDIVRTIVDDLQFLIRQILASHPVDVGDREWRAKRFHELWATLFANEINGDWGLQWWGLPHHILTWHAGDSLTALYSLRSYSTEGLEHSHIEVRRQVNKVGRHRDIAARLLLRWAAADLELREEAQADNENNEV